MKKYKELWDDFYKDGRFTMKYPSEPEIKFFARLQRYINLENLKALDFGCGAGRNLKFMESLGLDCVGLDISKEAIELCKKQNLEAILYDGKNIPFEDGTFDIVISFGVLDHMSLNEAKELIDEIYRVAKKGSHVLLVLHSVFDTNYEKGQEIEKGTIIIEDADFENGLPQHYFTRNELDLLISDKFKLERYTLHENQNFAYGTYSKDSFWELYLVK